MICLNSRCWPRSVLLAALLCLPASVWAEDPLAEAMLGEFAVQAGDFQAAAEHYVRAALASDDPDVAERAAQAAILAHDGGLVEQAMGRWAELDPGSRTLLATRAMQALRVADEAAAVEALSGLLALGDPVAVRVAIQVLSGSPDAGLSARVLELLLDGNALPDDDFQAWLALAGLAQRWNENTLTSSLVAEAVRRFPDEPRAWLLKAAQLRIDGDRDGARAAVEAALAADPGDTGLRIAAAGELERLGENELAERVLAEAVQDDAIYSTRAGYLARAGNAAGLAGLADEIEASLQGLSPRASSARRLLLGQISEYLGQFESAVRWYRGVPEGHLRAQAQLRAARALATAGDVDGALAVVRELQGDAGADGEAVRDAFVYEAELLAGREGDRAAVEAYGRGLAVFEDDALLLYARALAWVRLGRADRAEADLGRILAHDPDNAAALNALGYTLADRGERLDEAERHVRRALRLDPGNPAILDSMGWVLYRLGRPHEALPYLEQAWELMRDAEVGAHLGEVLWEVGERDEARGVWREAAELDAGNSVLRETLERYGQ